MTKLSIPFRLNAYLLSGFKHLILDSLSSPVKIILTLKIFFQKTVIGDYIFSNSNRKFTLELVPEFILVPVKTAIS